jgi:propanediol dehydratase small subunit
MSASRLSRAVIFMRRWGGTVSAVGGTLAAAGYGGAKFQKQTDAVVLQATTAELNKELVNERIKAITTESVLKQDIVKEQLRTMAEANKAAEARMKKDTAMLFIKYAFAAEYEAIQKKKRGSVHPAVESSPTDECLAKSVETEE